MEPDPPRGCCAAVPLTELRDRCAVLDCTGAVVRVKKQVGPGRGLVEPCDADGGTLLGADQLTMIVSMLLTPSEIGAVPSSSKRCGGMPTMREMSSSESEAKPAALAASRSSALKGVDGSSWSDEVPPGKRRRK